MCLPRRISLSLSTITLLTWCVLGTIGAGSQSAFAAHEQDIDDVINWVACQAGDGSDCGSFPGGQSLPSRYSAEQVEAALRGGVLETRDHVRNAYRNYFREYCAVPASRRAKETEARLEAAEAEIAAAEAEVREVKARLEARMAAEETAKLAAETKTEVETAVSSLAEVKANLALAKQLEEGSEGNVTAVRTALGEVAQARASLAQVTISDTELRLAQENADDLITKAKAEIEREEIAVVEVQAEIKAYLMKVTTAQMAVQKASLNPDVSTMFNQVALRLYAVDRWREAAYILSIIDVSDEGSGLIELKGISQKLADLRKEVVNDETAPYFFGTLVFTSEYYVLQLLEYVEELSKFRYNFNDFDVSQYNYSQITFPRTSLVNIPKTDSILDPKPALRESLKDIVGVFVPNDPDLSLVAITKKESIKAKKEYDDYLKKIIMFKDAQKILGPAQKVLDSAQKVLDSAQKRLDVAQANLAEAQKRLESAELAKEATNKLAESKTKVEAAKMRLLTAAQKLAGVRGTGTLAADLATAEGEIAAVEMSLNEAAAKLAEVRGPSGPGPDLINAQAKLEETKAKLTKARETERISELDCLAHPPPPGPDPRTLEKVAERESALSTARAASNFLSRKVVNRIQNLRSPGETSFEKPKKTSSTMTGINAGQEVRPDYPPNMGVAFNHSKSRISGQFETRSSYVLAMTETLLTPQRLAGLGLGIEDTRESLLGGSVKRSRGLTATAYLAEILNKNFTLVPQAALTFLDKEKQLVSGAKDDEKTMRTLFSLSILGQKQWGTLELSGFGQLAYTREDSATTDDDAIYLGQAIAGGECAFAVRANTHLFIGASMGYDLARSESTSDRFSYDGKLGLRSQLGSRAELSLSITMGGRDDERTKSGNVFVKIFF